MTQAEQGVLLIKGLIYDQPEPKRAEIMEWAEKFRALLTEGGDSAQVALTLVGAEFAAAN